MDRQNSRRMPIARAAAVSARDLARRYLWGSLMMIGGFAALAIVMALMR